MAAEVETMAYAGETPWHGLGTHVENYMTSEEAIAAAGLDWEVATGPLWGGPNTKKQVKYDDWRAIYRVDDGYPLGVCLGRFSPVQNREVFSFMDSLVEDGVLRYETAGSLKNGRRVFMLARLQELEGAEIAGDTYESYLLGVNGHDNLLSLRVFPTFVRVVCNNTLEMALGERGKNMHGGIMLRHVGNMEAKLNTAREVMRVTTGTQRRMQAWLTKAAQTALTDKQFEQVQEALFGTLDDETAPQRERAIKAFHVIYDEESMRVGETAYALINAVTGYSDHGIKPRGDDPTKLLESRFNSVLLDTGTSNMFKSKGIAAVEAATGLPKLAQIEVSELPKVFATAFSPKQPTPATADTDTAGTAHRPRGRRPVAATK